MWLGVGVGLEGRVGSLGFMVCPWNLVHQNCALYGGAYLHSGHPCQ